MSNNNDTKMINGFEVKESYLRNLSDRIDMARETSPGQRKIIRALVRHFKFRIRLYDNMRMMINEVTPLLTRIWNEQAPHRDLSIKGEVVHTADGFVCFVPLKGSMMEDEVIEIPYYNHHIDFNSKGKTIQEYEQLCLRNTKTNRTEMTKPGTLLLAKEYVINYKVSITLEDIEDKMRTRIINFEKALSEGKVAPRTNQLGHVDILNNVIMFIAEEATKEIPKIVKTVIELPIEEEKEEKTYASQKTNLIPYDYANQAIDGFFDDEDEEINQVAEEAAVYEGPKIMKVYHIDEKKPGREKPIHVLCNNNKYIGPLNQAPNNKFGHITATIRILVENSNHSLEDAIIYCNTDREYVAKSLYEGTKFPTTPCEQEFVTYVKTLNARLDFVKLDPNDEIFAAFEKDVRYEC